MFFIAYIWPMAMYMMYAILHVFFTLKIDYKKRPVGKEKQLKV